MQGYDVIRDFFIKDRPVLWPLMACSLVSLTITINLLSRLRTAGVPSVVFEVQENNRR